MGVPEGANAIESSRAYVSRWHLSKSAGFTFRIYVQATTGFTRFWPSASNRNIRPSQQYDEYGVHCITHRGRLYRSTTKRWSRHV